MKKKAYVAAWSGEIERARYGIATLRAQGFEITYNWTEPYRGAEEMTEEERVKVATDEMMGVVNADLVWVLLPEKSGAGVHTELGIALIARMALGSLLKESDTVGRSTMVVVSGALGRNIFDSLADKRFATDAEAHAWIVKEASHG